MLTPTKVITEANQAENVGVIVIDNQSSISVPTTNNQSVINNIPVEIRQDVMSKKDSIVFGDINSLQQFGSEIIEASARFTSDSTKMIKLGNAGEIGDKINKMITTTKTLDTSKLLDDSKPGFFGKLFGKAKSAIEEFSNDQKSINEAISTIGNNLLNDKKKLEDENRKLEAMYIQNEKNIKMFDIIVAAGMIRQEEMRQELENLRVTAQQSNKPEDANAFRMAESFLRQLETRVANINSARSIALLQSPQLRDMAEGNAMQIENIQSMVTIGIPAWHQQLAMLISQLETKKSIETTNALGAHINETIKTNSRVMGQNQVAIAEAANRSIIEFDTIQTVQTELLSAMDKTKQINEQGRIKRQETAQRLIQMESDLKQKMLQI